jgi:hypothetical protein
MQEVGMNYYFARREFDVIQAKWYKKNRSIF